MTPRLAAKILVSAMLRRNAVAGGSGAVLARGDEIAGAILIVIRDADGLRILERVLGPEGYRLSRCGPRSPCNDSAVDDYWQRRRSHDSDLWVVELDGANAERFAAETISTG